MPEQSHADLLRSLARLLHRAGPVERAPHDPTAPPRVVHADGEEATKAALRSLFGRDIDLAHLPAIAGAEPGTTVTVRPDAHHPHVVRLHLDHPDDHVGGFSMLRRGKDGQPELHIGLEESDPKGVFRGTGYKRFNRRVEALRAVGVPRVTLEAVSAGGYTGLQAWPKFGFDGPALDMAYKMPPELRKAAAGGPATFHRLRTLPGYAEWLKTATGSSRMEFLTDPESPHSKILKEYTDARDARGVHAGGGAGAGRTAEPGGGGGSPVAGGAAAAGGTGTGGGDHPREVGGGEAGPDRGGGLGAVARRLSRQGEPARYAEGEPRIGPPPPPVAAHYAVYSTRHSTGYRPRLEQRHATLGAAVEARDDLVAGRQRSRLASHRSDGDTAFHLYAVYPDGSRKILPSGGEESGGYHTRDNQFHEHHTADRNRLFYLHDAHRAYGTTPRAFDLLLGHLSAITGPHTPLWRAAEETGPDTHDYLRAMRAEALHRHALLPFEAMADMIEERMDGHRGAHSIRTAIQKYRDRWEPERYERMTESPLRLAAERLAAPERKALLTGHGNPDRRRHGTLLADPAEDVRAAASNVGRVASSLDAANAWVDDTTNDLVNRVSAPVTAAAARVAAPVAAAAGRLAGKAKSAAWRADAAIGSAARRVAAPVVNAVAGAPTVVHTGPGGEETTTRVGGLFGASKAEAALIGEAARRRQPYEVVGDTPKPELSPAPAPAAPPESPTYGFADEKPAPASAPVDASHPLVRAIHGKAAKEIGTRQPKGLGVYGLNKAGTPAVRNAFDKARSVGGFKFVPVKNGKGDRLLMVSHTDENGHERIGTFGYEEAKRVAGRSHPEVAAHLAGLHQTAKKRGGGLPARARYKRRGSPEKYMADAPIDPQKAALLAMEPRARKGFRAYMADLYRGDEANMHEHLADEDSRLDHFHDYLKDEHQIRVRPDGLVEFYNADGPTRRIVGDLPVMLYHHTSDAIKDKVLKEGLVLRQGKRANPHLNTGAGVYVTTEYSGPAVSGYIDNATQFHGGGPQTWGVRTHLHELAPDPDDADISSGRHQFVLPYVAPHDLIDVSEEDRQSFRKAHGLDENGDKPDQFARLREAVARLARPAGLPPHLPDLVTPEEMAQRRTPSPTQPADLAATTDVRTPEAKAAAPATPRPAAPPPPDKAVTGWQSRQAVGEPPRGPDSGEPAPPLSDFASAFAAKAKQSKGITDALKGRLVRAKGTPYSVAHAADRAGNKFVVVGIHGADGGLVRHAAFTHAELAPHVANEANAWLARHVKRVVGKLRKRRGGSPARYMHEDGPAILQAAHDRPDDETPHLVYADWADDHDMPELAAHIRGAVGLTRDNPDWGKLFHGTAETSWVRGTPPPAGEHAVYLHPYYGGSRAHVEVHAPHPDGKRTAYWSSGTVPAAEAHDLARRLLAEGHHPGNDDARRLAAEAPAPDRFARLRGLVRRYAAPRGDFLDALRRVRSANQRAVHEAVGNVAKKLGITGHKTVDALFDTPAASLPGVAQALGGPARDPAVARYAAAWHGLLSDSPGVAVFHVGDGPDMIHRFRVGGSVGELRQKLDAAGIGRRHLLPHQHGCDILVADEGGGLAGAVRQFAAANKATLETSRGTLERLGGADKGAARAKYRQVVTEFEGQGKARLSRKGDLRRYMMSDGEALLRAAFDRPDDETPHLVYADWADDQGMSETASFIRGAVAGQRAATSIFPRVRKSYKLGGPNDGLPASLVSARILTDRHGAIEGHLVNLRVNDPGHEGDDAFVYQHWFPSGHDREARRVIRSLASEGHHPHDEAAKAIVASAADEPSAPDRLARLRGFLRRYAADPFGEYQPGSQDLTPPRPAPAPDVFAGYAQGSDHHNRPPAPKPGEDIFAPELANRPPTPPVPPGPGAAKSPAPVSKRELTARRVAEQVRGTKFHQHLLQIQKEFGHDEFLHGLVSAAVTGRGVYRGGTDVFALIGKRLKQYGDAGHPMAKRAAAFAAAYRWHKAASRLEFDSYLNDFVHSKLTAKDRADPRLWARFLYTYGLDLAGKAHPQGLDRHYEQFWRAARGLARSKLAGPASVLGASVPSADLDREVMRSLTRLALREGERHASGGSGVRGVLAPKGAAVDGRQAAFDALPPRKNTAYGVSYAPAYPEARRVVVDPKSHPARFRRLAAFVAANRPSSN